MDSKVDEQLVSLLSHPLRAKALVVLVERTASPKEISVQLEENLSTVSHHVRALLKLGLIELVRTEPRRGAIEHYYRSVLRPVWTNKQWGELTPKERQRFATWTVQLITNDVAEALNAGIFNARSDSHTSRTPLHVDEQGWRDINQILDNALEAVFQVQAESDERRTQDDTGGIYASASMLCTEMPAPEGWRSRLRQSAASTSTTRSRRSKN
jgi:DNA-binding transcriptional ArsR family regulator